MGRNWGMDQALVEAMRTARRPWETPDAEAGDGYVKRATPGWAYMREEAKEEIEMCLNCKKSRCTNCLGSLKG